MNDRLEIAKFALNGLCSLPNCWEELTIPKTAERALMIADALIALEADTRKDERIDKCTGEKCIETK